jgi:hypothetical protein
MICGKSHPVPLPGPEKHSPPLLVLLLALLACSQALWAGQEPMEQARNLAEQELAYREAIDAIESDYGAYGDGLSEQILGLGHVLQSQGRHQEALALLKRGVHLARINDGLYSPQQLPLLQAEIASHIALGQYDDADERQHYMYRVQVRSMGQGELRAQALMQQAQWQYNAYQLRLGQAGFARLMSMWDLYRLALNDIIEREGENSPDLLPPLEGMLRAQYLIADYEPEDEYADAEDFGARQQLGRFNAYRAQSYDKGSAVILAMYGIEQKQEESQGEETGLATARALTMLGDWRLWHEEREKAMQAYGEAIAELNKRDDAQLQIARLFGEPVALPNLDGVRQLAEVEEPGLGDILLEFGVTERGRVVDLERIDDNEDVNQAKANRVMRQLRKTRFRPRFDAGQPVVTEKVVRAYEVD